jgi:hypothetical protein
MVGAKKTDVNGRVMWEDSDGQRFSSPDDTERDMYGWTKVDVNGRMMWESPEGERSF